VFIYQPKFILTRNLLNAPTRINI